MSPTTKETLHQPNDKNTPSGFQMLPSCALNAMTRGEISATAYATLAAITAYVRDTREERDAAGGDRQTVRLFRRDLAAMTGATPRTVSFHTAQLKEAGLLAISQDPWGGPSMYTVKDPCGACFSVQPIAPPLATDRNPPSNELQGIPSLRYLDNQSEEETIEAEAERRHRAHAESAIAQKRDRGETFSSTPVAYRRGIMNNQDQREEFRNQVRKEQEHQREARELEACRRCDSHGLIAIDENTNAKCSHTAKVPA